MESFDTKLNMILDKLELLDKKMDLLDKKINDCEKSCQNMDNHIHFINDTYISLRTPLDFFRSKVNTLIGQTSNDLPEITNE